MNSLERVQSVEWAEFVVRARDAGKLRFSGMSGHGTELVRCLEAALEAGIRRSQPPLCDAELFPHLTVNPTEVPRLRLG